MRTAAILIAPVIALIVGIVLTLRTSAKTGMPSAEVLERAKRRARELASRETEANSGE